jgi:hypothetical protein
LLNKYPELYQFLKISENGQWTLENSANSSDFDNYMEDLLDKEKRA